MFDLSSIHTGKVNNPIRIALNGVEGIGKSSFGAQAPNPIFLATEDGLDNIDTSSLKIGSTEQMIGAFNLLLNEQHDYKTVVVDSIDAYEPMLWDHVSTKHQKKSIEDFGYGRGYIEASNEWRSFLSGLNALRMKKGMNVILLAHPLIKRFDSPESAPYDRYQIKLHKTAAALVTEWADAVLFANYRVYTQETDTGFNKKINRGTGNGERILNTTERPAFHAKNRFDLPDIIPFNKDTAWNEFYTLVQQSRGITVPHATPQPETQLP